MVAVSRLARVTCLLSLAAGLASCSGKPEAPAPPSGPAAPTGGAAPGSGKAARTIVFIFKKSGLSYGAALERGAKKAQEDLSKVSPGIQVVYQAPDQATAEGQIAIMDQWIANKADAIVVSPNDDKAIIPIMKKAADQGVKVFTWDSDAPDSGRLFYVTAAPDVEIGVQIADALAKDMGGKGKVQVVSGGRNANNLNLHVQGFEQGFKKYPGITLIQPYIYNDDDNTKARDMAAAAFTKDPDVAGFACANSPSAPAVGEVVTQKGKIGGVKVWGLALPSETRQYLKSGAVNGIILWDPAKLTYLTAVLVNDKLDGKDPQDGKEYDGIGKISVKDGVVLMPDVKITKENVDQFQF